MGCKRKERTSIQIKIDIDSLGLEETKNLNRQTVVRNALKDFGEISRFLYRDRDVLLYTDEKRLFLLSIKYPNLNYITIFTFKLNTLD